MRSVHLRAGAVFACLALLWPVAAEAQQFTYDLVLTAKLENGRQVDMPGFPITDFFECLHQKKKTQIGRKFGRGLLVDANGKSLGGTIIGARCVQRIPKMGQ
jgi:hypothetical protein